jgi:hypothetical protein
VSKHSENFQLGVWALIVIVSVEALAVAVVAGFLLWATLSGGSGTLSTALALDIVVVIFAAALIIVAIGVATGKPAARSGAFVWQVLQMALGLGSNDQSVFSRPDIASALTIPAIAALLLILFNKGVREHFSDERRDGTTAS